MIIRRSMLSMVVLVGLLIPMNAAVRAQDYPTGPITFVVPFPPGGSIDAILRTMAPKLQERMGKPVLIENRAGGGGVIGTTSVAKSPPDGHTLFAAPSLLAANPKLYKTLPFDTLKDLQMVSLLFRTPLVLVVNPDVPAKSVSELVALLKQKPDQISFAHSGPGSSLHLAAELFQAMTGTKMNGVAYRGAPPGLNDVMAGHVALMFADTGTVVAQIAAGKVRALGVTSTTRVPVAPDIPTIAEAGVPGFEAVGWTLMCVPAATPKPIIDRLHAELKGGGHETARVHFTRWRLSGRLAAGCARAAGRADAPHRRAARPWGNYYGLAVRPPFGLPEVLVAVCTSILFCRKAEKTPIFTLVHLN